MTTPSPKTYLVSAIVSTYSAERFLRGKLEDLEAQTIAEHLEIIVVDSASPQNERAVVEEFQSRYDNIRYLRTERRETVYQAWNRGIRMATGEFITNANTDDRLRNDAYEILVRALREHPECVLAYPDMRITRQENATFAAHERFGFRDWPAFDRLGLLELCCVGPFPLWRRSLHDEIGYFDERFKSAADYEFWLRAALTRDFIHVPEFLGLYWLSEETVSRKGDLPTLEYLEVQKEYRPRYAPLTPPPVELDPKQQDAFRLLAARLEGGDATVLTELERFDREHPRAARFHLELAEIFYRMNEIGYAKKHFEKAAIVAPGCDTCRDRLLGFLKSELYQALQHQTAFTSANPDDLEARLCTGMILVLMERYEAALSHYRRALEIDPHSAPARENLAFAQRRLSPDGGDAYFSCRRPEVARMVSRRARRVLDVGCAAGALGSALKKRQGAEVWGVEPDPKAAAAAARLLDRVLEGGIEAQLPRLPRGAFDSIVTADVLEHLSDPEAVLSGLAEKLSPWGELVVSLPNVRHWSVVRGLLEGSWEYCDAGILDRTHLKFFTKKSALALFDRAGYEVTATTPIALDGGGGIPGELAQALGGRGIDVSTLEEESGVYQYLFRLVPKGRELTSIVILTYNELACTRECLESIERHTPEAHEVILVDNGSTDGTLPFLRELCREKKGYRLIENGRNLGFAAGCNAGMRVARGGHVLLLNNDVVVTPGWLSGMLEALAREEGAGLAGPMSNEVAGAQKVAARYENLAELERFASSFRSGHYGRRIATDKLVGFCLLFTREVLEKVGELDARFGSGNFEDDDFCLRAALEGFGCVIAGDVFVHHYGSRTFTGNRIDHAAAMRKNRVAFDAKWDPSLLEAGLAARLLAHNARLQGIRAAREGKVNHAVDLFLTRVLPFAGGNPAPYLDLAGLLAEAGNLKEALEVLDGMPGGGTPGALLLRSRCHRELKEAAQALRAAQLCAELDPERAGLLAMQGALALDAKDQQRGEELLRRALLADPGCACAADALASLFWERGDRVSALQLAELSFTLAPQELSHLARYHEYATSCDALPREEERLREALALYPGHKGLIYGLIELFIRSDRHEEALEAIGETAARHGLDDGSIDAALQIRGLVPPLPPPRRGGGSISLCMIVKDEAHQMACALDSARRIADEIIVVDTGSADRTRDVARIFGARLFDFSWNGSFADARNFSLEQAGGDWILVLDADEVLARCDRAPLAELAKESPPGVAYSFTTRNYTDELAVRNWTANRGEYPEEERGRGWTPSEKVRLFPNRQGIRFEGVVHELLEPSLLRLGFTLRACDVPVHHYGKLDRERCREKQQRYYEMGVKKLAESDASPEALLELARQATELQRVREAENLWHRLLEVQPDDAEADFNLGYLYLCEGDYSRAHRHALKGVRLAPELKEAAFNLAKCELFLGRPEEALARSKEMLSRWPDHPPALSLYASSLLVTGERGEGEAQVARLSAMRYDCADFLNEYAAGLEKGGHAALAAPLFELAARYREGKP